MPFIFVQVKFWHCCQGQYEEVEAVVLYGGEGQSFISVIWKFCGYHLSMGPAGLMLPFNLFYFSPDIFLIFEDITYKSCLVSEGKIFYLYRRCSNITELKKIIWI